MATHPRRPTADDMLELPTPDGVIGFEFVDGRPVPVMPASPLHGNLIVRVASRLEAYVEAARIPGQLYVDAGFVLDLARDPERMRGPDVSFVSEAKVRAHPNPERLFRCRPDLAIEIDITSERKPGGQQRILDYLEAGVRLIWAIHPRTRSAHVYRQDGTSFVVREHEALDGEDVVPGFRLPLAELFR
ncbi:MAG: Uma2 family endonuclease [Gemmatimonadetes bacterium]|nr:Uma2 family endonuclease [Gemmatimonadota bacterium]